MKRSILALILCAALLVTVLAGCAGGNSGTTTAATTAAAGSDTAAATTAPAEEGNEHVDLSFVWTNWNNKSEEDDAVFAWVNDKFNCTFDWINLASDVRTEKLGVMWASGDKFTCSFGLEGTSNAECMKVQYDNGWIYALDEFIPKLPTISEDIADACWAYVKMDDGKLYGIPEQGCDTKTGLWVRQDWLKTVGLEAPTNLTEFEAMMDAFRNNDPDGDGEQNTYGADVLFGGFQSYDHYLLSCFLPYGDSWQPLTDGSSETLYPKFMHPEYVTYLEMLARWNADGYIHPNQVMMNYDTSIAAFVQGEVGSFLTWYGEGDSGVGLLLAAAPDSDPVFVPAPVNDNGQGGVMAQKLYGGSLVFNKKATEAEVARYLDIIDYYCTTEGNSVRNFGIPGVQWEDNGETIKVPEGKEKVYSSYCRLPGGDYCKRWRPLEGGLECVNTATINCYQGIYPSIRSFDYMFPYNWSGTESENKISDLNDMVTTCVDAIVSGNATIDSLADMIESWKAAGGEKYIEEYNAQYQEMKPIYGAN